MSRKFYWDSSCFICFLNADEAARSYICDDILNHANAGDIEIWISVWVIVEVVRPRRPSDAPLPEWALNCIKAVPESRPHIEDLWARFQRKNPVTKLTPLQISQIQAMFEWPFIRKVQVDELVARKAVELSRDYNLASGDAIHAATAILWKCDTIQRWDKDYSKVSHLIASEEPQRISPQGELMHHNNYGPSPQDLDTAQ